MPRRAAPVALSLALAAVACSEGPPAAPGGGDPVRPQAPITGPARELGAAAGDRGHGRVAPTLEGPTPEAEGGAGGEPDPGAMPLRFAVKGDYPLPEGYDTIAPGFALFDLDADGDLDVFVPMLQAPSFVLRNEGGFTFTRLDAAIGIPADVRAAASALGDCDGDGSQDLLIAGADRFALLRHVGDRFEEIPDAGVAPGFTPGSSLFYDADGDTDLDLVVTCYHGDSCRSGHRLYENDGSCRFTDVTGDTFAYATRRAHAVGAFDPDEDGDTDLLIASDLGGSFEPDLVLQNDGRGNFTDVAAELNLRHEAFSMSTEIADVDGDGRLDVYMGNICRNPLAVNQGPGLPYVERDEELGVPGAWYVDPLLPPLVIPYLDPDDPLNEPELQFRAEYVRGRPDHPHAFCLTSWATPTADLDADGERELLVVNGAVGNVYEGLHEPNLLYRRSPGETVFSEVGALAGLKQRGWGRTGVFADLDGDGRLDLVIGHRARRWPEDAPGFFYRNVTSRSRIGHQLLVHLRGPGANTDGVGAVVEVTAGGRTQIAYRSLGTSFLSASAAPLQFGLGEATAVDSVVVRWPWGGGIDRFEALGVDHTVTLRHGDGR